ncbi:D-lysergyl-peptide-synthetase subunit 1 [Claviceps africana]|nr:D-lysergyl-peptide-synthetase subunit 1 [Claviceps africana]
MIEGAILSRGYLGDVERTAAAFAAPPDWLRALRGGEQEPNGRVYLTGDVGRQNSDGSISFVRRADAQVKVRGQRVELADVEHQVEGCFRAAIQVVADSVPVPGVDSSMLVALVFSSAGGQSAQQEAGSAPAIEGQGAGDTGMRFLASDPSFTADANAAEQAMRDRVPAYMVPDLFVSVSGFPREPSGKVSRRAIRQHLVALFQEDWRRYASTGIELPGNKTEHELRAIWARVLRIEPETFGVHDSFFRLGGDSVSSMQVVLACAAAGMCVTVKDVFEQRTIRKLAALAQASGAPEQTVTSSPAAADHDGPNDAGGEAASASPAVWYPEGKLDVYTERAERQLGASVESIYPCSPIQKGILVSHARNPRHYDEVIRWRVAGDAPIDAARLQHAWHQVVARHAILRTIFLHVSDDSVFDQAVLREYRPDVSVSDGGEEDDEEKGEATQPFHDNAVPWHYLRLHRPSSDNVMLCLRIHHALVDGASLQTIRRDLERAYQGRLGALDAPPGFREYIAYLHRIRQRGSSSDHYWKSYLEGVTGCLFPTLVDQSAPKRLEFGTVDIELASPATLARFCEKHKLATTVVLHIIWAVVLQRYTATDEVCFGYMTSGRHADIARVEHVVGPLFNMLVARIVLAYPLSLLSIMGTYQERFLGSLHHQHQPLAETLHSIGSSSGDLFNTMVTVVNDLPEGAGASQQPSDIRLVGDGVQSRSEYPITINILNGADKMRMQLSYHTSLLSAETAQHIAMAFRYVLQRTLDQPEGLLADLQVMDDEKMRTAYAPHSHVEPPLRHLIHETIQRHCVRSPDASAVCSWDGDLTYGQLDALSSSLAEDLIRRGAGPEVTIPILVEKARWTPVAVLAVLKSGSSFVLMDSSHPAARLGAIILSLHPPVMIVSAQTRPKAVAFSTDMIEIEDQLARGDAHVHGPDGLGRWDEHVFVKPSNAAYLVFTSGSTGKPKGAIVEHASLSTAAECTAARFHLDATSRVLQFSSHAWDVAVMDILLTLRAGGCVCIPSEDERTSHLAQAANRMRVNWALLTPTVARLFRPDDFSHLETLVLAGEALSSTDVSTWSRRVRLIQAYGPAECAAVCTLTEPLTASDDPRCVGRPSGCVAWVVNRANHELLAPPGAVGELVVEGPIVGRGYLGDPERSATAFVRPPVWLRTLRGKDAPARLYKTGDLVRQDVRSGRLTFVGRNDDQVKIRGQRVEPGEVEAQVARVFPGCHVVVMMARRSGKANLVAFVLDGDGNETASSAAAPGNAVPPPSPAFAESARAAFSQLREMMPTYMMPSFILPLSYLPRASTGKADRKVLRDCLASLSDDELGAYVAADVGHRAASSAIEAQLQELVGQVLHKPTHAISLDEDLFRMGLDSLTAMTLTTTARRRGWEIPVPLIFQHSRISDLALVLARKNQEKQQGATGLDEAPMPNPVASLLPRVCTEWRLDERQVVSIAPTTYYQQISVASDHDTFIGLHFSRPAAAQALAAAAGRVVEHHSILRTVFVPFEDSHVQLTLQKWHLPTEEVRTDEDSLAATIALFCRDAAQAAPEHGIPLTKLVLMVDGHGGCLAALLRLQRAQFDGVAVMRIMADWRAALEGQAWPAASKPDYADFVLRRAAQNTPDVFDMWRDVLCGSSMTYLRPQDTYLALTDRARCEERLATSTCDIALPEPVHAFTMATVAKAAWTICLAQQTRLRDIVFLQLVRNRSLPLDGIENMVGSCLNYVPVRVPLEPGWTVSHLLRWIQQQHVRTMPGDTADWPHIVARSTPWPPGTEFGSVLHYLSAPAAPVYDFSGGVSAEFRLYEDKMVHTCPCITCIVFPDVGDAAPARNDMRIIVTSAVGGQELTDRLLAMFQALLHEINDEPDRMLSDWMRGGEAL